MLTYAGSETFRNRLLRRPARGIVFVRIFERVAVRLLFFGKNSLKETLPVLR